MPAYDSKLQLKAPGLQGASTSGTPVDLGNARPNAAQLLQFDLLWSALSGTTPTADIVIEESADQTNWRQVATFRQLNSTGTPPDNTFTGANGTGKKMARFGLVTQRYLRYRSTLSAGGGLNFSLNALGIEAVARGTSTLTY